MTDIRAKPGNGFIDITNQRFGSLVVLSREIVEGKKRAYWRCQCDCGNQSVVCGKSLRNKDTQSCGCKSNVGQLIDLTGKMFGRLTVIERRENLPGGEPQWLCLCACGNSKIIAGERLRKKRSQSCGCLRREQTAEKFRTHGMTNTRTYRIWCQLRSRCCNPNDTGWDCYGGRGIKVCDRWRYSFESFLEDMGECPGDEYSIERIEVNGDYEPSNCKWLLLSEQGSNTRRSVKITYRNETKTIAQWSRLTGIHYGTLRRRIADGWDVETALNKPVGRWAK